MNGRVDRRALVAVDLGAQSCRVSLLRWRPDGLSIELVHRVANRPIERDGALRWDWQAICSSMEAGLRQCGDTAQEGIASIGVTGWAVDYVRLAPDGEPIENPFCYRDPRTVAAMQALHERIPPQRLYALTGIQVLPINTLYQLYADMIAGVPKHLRWLNLPEALLHRWGSRPVAEYTNATPTGMIDLTTQHWSQEIFSAAGIAAEAAPEIVPPGSIVGRLQGPLANIQALRDTLLIAPACHDTASAIAGIDAVGNDWAYISSGTWSLVGALLDSPCAGAEAARLNFTNEGGVGGRVCFLRNVNGLWLLNQCLESWNAAGNRVKLDDILGAAATLPQPQTLIDVDDPDLLLPGDTPGRILSQLHRKSHSSTSSRSSPADIASVILHSLAARYATVLRQTETLTGKHFTRLYIVGGGGKNALLNRLTHQTTGLQVLRGSEESSTIGNFAVQLAALEKCPPGRTTHPEGVDHDAVALWAKTLQGAMR